MLEADANGFVSIAWTDNASRSIMNQKKTVNIPADLSGLKIRCMQDPILGDSTNAMVQSPRLWVQAGFIPVCIRRPLTALPPL